MLIEKQFKIMQINLVANFSFCTIFLEEVSKIYVTVVTKNFINLKSKFYSDITLELI